MEYAILLLNEILQGETLLKPQKDWRKRLNYFNIKTKLSIIERAEIKLFTPK